MINDILEGLPQEDIEAGRKYIRHLAVGEARRETKRVRGEYKVERDKVKYKGLEGAEVI